MCASFAKSHVGAHREKEPEGAGGFDSVRKLVRQDYMGDVT